MCKIISLLYYNKKEGKLNEHRFQHFKRSTSRSSFSLESLPPTEGAAKQHGFRVYLQLQAWLGNEMEVIDWGWKLDDNLLIPVYTVDALIPDEILKKISCTCVSGCKNKTCGCKKNYLKCTSVCLHCDSTKCSNFETLPDNIINVDDSSDFLEEIIESTEDTQNTEHIDNDETLDDDIEDNATDSDTETDNATLKKRKVADDNYNMKI